MATRKSKGGGACQRGAGGCQRGAGACQRAGGCGCQRPSWAPQMGGQNTQEPPPNWLKESISQTALAVKGPQAVSQLGGYKATAKDKKYLKLYKQGKSIGFTMRASLKAKGLLPRTSKTMKGKKVLGAKYR